MEKLVKPEQVILLISSIHNIMMTDEVGGQNR